MIEAFRRTPCDREILRIGLPSFGVLMLVRATTLWWWYAKRFAMNGPDPSPSSPAA